MPKSKYADARPFQSVLNWRVTVFLSNFVFQGIRYMSLGEKIYKLSITLGIGFLFSFFLNNLLVSLFCGHLWNYLFNGQFFVLYRYLGQKPVMSKKKLLGFLEKMEKGSTIFSVRDILFYGSICRGTMSQYSDLDLRIFHTSGFFSSLQAYIFATCLRFYAVFKRFPIDVYCFSSLDFLDERRIRKDEVPVSMFMETEIKSLYENKVVSLEERLSDLVIR